MSGAGGSSGSALVPIAHLWQSRRFGLPQKCYGIGTRPFGSPPAPHVKTNEFAGSDGGEAVSRLAAAWASAFSFQVNVLDTGDQHIDLFCDQIRDKE